MCIYLSQVTGIVFVAHFGYENNCSVTCLDRKQLDTTNNYALLLIIFQVRLKITYNHQVGRTENSLSFLFRQLAL